MSTHVIRACVGFTLDAPATPTTGLPSTKEIEDFVKGKSPSDLTGGPTLEIPTGDEPPAAPPAPPLGQTPEPATHATPTESVHDNEAPAPGVLLVAAASVAAAWLARRRRSS